MDETKWPTFPEPTRKSFDRLWGDLASLHLRWTLYLGLYGTPEAVAVLNATARGAFQLIQGSLRDDMTMAIGRLTDPAAMARKDNLSLERLINDLAPHVGEDDRDRWARQLAGIREACTDFTRLRNKRVGHTDLNAALRVNGELLPGIARPYVENALRLMRELMNDVQRRFGAGVTHFEGPVMDGTGEHLIFYLRKSLDTFEEERLRMLGRAAQRAG